MKPLGYHNLTVHFGLKTMPHHCISWLQEGGRRRTLEKDGRREEFYTPRDNPGDSWTDQLQFALKHEGVNIEILAALFETVPADELSGWISSAPTGRYTRISWFLFEWLTGRHLSLPDLEQGSYLAVLDEREQYTLPYQGTMRHVRRQRIINNLIGTPEYCPQIRRTSSMKSYEQMELNTRAADLVRDYPRELLYRASQFLYRKETKSSFALEHLTADQRRAGRFIALLRQAGSLDCYSEEVLVQLQNVIVDERYAENGFRSGQNYVGQSLGPGREIVHYITPKPEDLRPLMTGWSDCCKMMQEAGVYPVVTATVAGFGFVFLHPFEDGNGRLHRFLLHHALTAGSFSPAGVIFPVSATMLRQIHRYDRALEAYSRPVGERAEYTLDDDGRMTVLNETGRLYRYPDLTEQAEALFGFMEETIRTDLTAELDYLVLFDAVRNDLRRLLDMPDKRLDLLVRLLLQGNGKLSKTKRALFSELTDDECTKAEECAIDAIPPQSGDHGR
jgi:Fic/DOC family